MRRRRRRISWRKVRLLAVRSLERLLANPNARAAAAIVIVLVLTASGAMLFRKAYKALRPDEVPANVSGAVLSTEKGEIEIEFVKGEATSTIDNFERLARQGFFDGTRFHRVRKGYLIQGGDPFTRGADRGLYGRGGPGYTIPDEINDEPMTRGVVAMANYGPDTNGSQFFILLASSTPDLAGKHTVFARVTKGIEVADAIAAAPVTAATADAPKEPVVLEKVRLKK